MLLSRANEGRTQTIALCSNGAASESRILVTIDTDFGQLVFLENAPHCGLIRLPDVPAKERLRLIEDLLTRFSSQLEEAAIITVRGGRVRISKSPQ